MVDQSIELMTTNSLPKLYLPTDDTHTHSPILFMNMITIMVKARAATEVSRMECHVR